MAQADALFGCGINAQCLSAKPNVGIISPHDIDDGADILADVPSTDGKCGVGVCDWFGGGFFNGYPNRTTGIFCGFDGVCVAFFQWIR